MSRQRLAACVLAAALAGYANGAAAAQRPPGGRLQVVVKDPSGAVIPGAIVQVKGAEERTASVVRGDIASDGQGVARAEDLVPGRYTIEVSFPAFETLVIPDVRVRAGDNRREAVLKIQKLDETVSVGRDKATVASDPNNDRFNTVLSKDQINALPDDPDEMERVLKEMAGPGAVMRVDGFRGGKLPPKAQIRSIRFSRDMYAAENHAAGMVFVDIVTQPGLGPLRGSLDFLFRDDSLNARNAFVTEKGPEQTQQYTFNMSGTLRKERTSFSLSATGASLYDSANINALSPDGSRSLAAIRRPADRLNFNGRLDHAINKAHTLRANLQTNGNQQKSLGVGGFELGDRSFARTTDDSMLRLSEGGPWSRNVFVENRLQLRRQATTARSDIEAQAVRVLDTFTIGGAQQAGGRESFDVEWATNLDWTRGRHAVRAGVLLEGGSYESDNRTNYLGTFTFTSMAEYEAGRPASYTQRLGDPRVEYSQWQAGLFIQDDWRARSNLTVSAGLRQELQSHLDDRLNLAPRASATWSPFRNGKTTVRAGGGIFYEWLESEIYEQVLRVDGTRQQDLVITNPGYPDPFSGGVAQQILPASRYLLGDGLVMPTRIMGNVGLSHQFSPKFGMNVSYTRTRGENRFRGRNVNAPLNGLRPDLSLGNVTQVESTANMRGETFVAGMNLQVPAKRIMLFANYAWLNQESDADGAFSLPADSYDLSNEWGPVTGVPRHSVSGMFSMPLITNMRVALNGGVRSGTPYTITTGRDDNGDTVFNDRPAGVARNSARTEMTWELGGRLSYAFGFGRRPPAGGADGHGQPTIVIQRIGGASGSDISGAFGGGADDKRIRFELFASGSNLFNAVNRVGYSGVMTSPFFGRPTAAMPGRRVDVGLRVGF
ncbi:MAG TPA: carboxypeptidase-like regulatory domain-containing protein [Vicinamibacterales bacterium]|nr:carboxypeptidase-like regulatory domain-containing protein [Vicinamibacterales bacterium]